MSVDWISSLLIEMSRGSFGSRRRLKFRLRVTEKEKFIKKDSNYCRILLLSCKHFFNEWSNSAVKAKGLA